MSAIVAALALTLGALAVNGWLAHLDRGLDVLTPEPARVVQSFVGALAARRPASAAQQLAESARTAATIARLRELAASDERGRFVDASTDRSGETAIVRARLRTAHGIEVRDLALARDPDSRLWKITRFD